MTSPRKDEERPESPTKVLEKSMTKMAWNTTMGPKQMQESLTQILKTVNLEGWKNIPAPVCNSIQGAF